MAKKATGKSGAKSSGKAGKKTGTSVARAASSGGDGRNDKQGGFDASEAFIKLLQSPLAAELVAVAATAALAALAEHGFTSRSGDDAARGKRAGKAVKEAGKAAAAAIGRRLSTELEEVRAASKAKAGAEA